MKMKSTKRIKKIGCESKRRRKNLEDDHRHLQARLQVHPHHRKESYQNLHNRKCLHSPTGYLDFKFSDSRKLSQKSVGEITLAFWSSDSAGYYTLNLLFSIIPYSGTLIGSPDCQGDQKYSKVLQPNLFKLI